MSYNSKSRTICRLIKLKTRKQMVYTTLENIELLTPLRHTNGHDRFFPALIDHAFWYADEISELERIDKSDSVGKCNKDNLEWREW